MSQWSIHNNLNTHHNYPTPTQPLHHTPPPSIFFFRPEVTPVQLTECKIPEHTNSDGLHPNERCIPDSTSRHPEQLTRWYEDPDTFGGRPYTGQRLEAAKSLVACRVRFSRATSATDPQTCISQRKLLQNFATARARFAEWKLSHTHTDCNKTPFFLLFFAAANLVANLQLQKRPEASKACVPLLFSGWKYSVWTQIY